MQQELAARFRTRELYEVPKEPGICYPYGFIADDGKTTYDIKNSLRFTRTPNVIFSFLIASAQHPDQIPPTSGIYTTDLFPSYDRTKWQWGKLIDGLYFGKRLAAFDGWRLDSRRSATPAEGPDPEHQVSLTPVRTVRPDGQQALALHSATQCPLPRQARFAEQTRVELERGSARAANRAS